MIWAALTDLPRWAKVAGTAVLAAAILMGLWLWIGSREEADDKANQQIGAAIQREGDLTETIKQVEKANEAEARIERDPDARHAGCLRHSRTPENC